MRQAKLLVLAFLAFVLVACASTLGGQRADVNAGTQTVGLYANKLAVLVNSGLISKSEAQARLTVLDTAQEALREAAAALAICEAKGQDPCPGANVGLATATAALNSIELWLIEREKGKQ